MKKLMTKIRNKKLKGNVSLLVIFVLLASSVISLLSINQIQRLLTYGNMTFNYFRAFYIAKAWNELWLTEVYNSGNGFNHTILSGDAIVTGNLVWIYTGFKPYFNMNISWSFSTLTKDVRNSECEEENKIRLETWAGIMLSLFSDNNENLNDILSGKVGNELLSNFSNLSLTSHEELTFAFFTYNENGEMVDIVVDKWGDLGEFLRDKNVQNGERWYITIKNSWDFPVEFCVEMDGNQLIPYSDFLITVFWHYGDMEVGLQSIVKKWVPDWTLNVLGDPTSSF